MASFNTKCPHCSTELQVQDEWIGMEVECSECQKTFKIFSLDTDERKFSPPPFQGVQPQSSTPPPFQGVQPQSSTPPPFQGVQPQSNTPPPFQGVQPQSSTYTNEINIYVKQKLDLYIAAMDVAIFLFVVLLLLVCMANSNNYILMSLTIGCFWAAVGIEGYLLWETIKAIPEKRRRQHPLASAILMLIPGWCFIWNFITLPRTASDLNDEILRMGKEVPKNLYWTAGAHCIYTVIMILLAIATPHVIKASGSSAGMWGSITFLVIMMICAIACQHKTYSNFAKAVAIIKSEEAE